MITRTTRPSIRGLAPAAAVPLVTIPCTAGSRLTDVAVVGGVVRAAS